MTRTVNSSVQSEISKTSNIPIRIYTIHDYNGSGSNLYFAEYDTNINFDGIEYTRFPITFDKISENNTGQIDSVQISVANVSRLIQSYLEDYDFRGKKVTIRTVFSGLLYDADAHVDDIYYIDSYTANQLTVSFILTSRFDVLDVQIPLRRYTRNHCGWIFKSTECGYSGAESVCNKTKDRCKQLANYSRFGGFPSINPSRVVLS